MSIPPGNGTPADPAERRRERIEAAMADYDPDWSTGPVQLLELAVVDVFGRLVAVDPGFIDLVAEHNRAAYERRDQKARKRAEGNDKTKKKARRAPAGGCPALPLFPGDSLAHDLAGDGRAEEGHPGRVPEVRPVREVGGVDPGGAGGTATPAGKRPGRSRNWRPLTTPVRWHGSKSRRNIHILPHFPEHRVYVEPYGGSLALLFKKPPAEVEVAGDLDVNLMGFWQVVQGADALREFLNLARPFREAPWNPPPPEEWFREQFDEAWRGLDGGRGDPVQRSWWFFVAMQLSMSGRPRDFSGGSRTGRTRGGTDERLNRILNTLDRLPLASERLRGVRLFCRPALETIAEFDGPDALHLLDPPYVPESRSAPNVYAVEMSEADHRGLLCVLPGLRGKAILCGYDNPLYNAALAGWRRVCYTVPNDGAGGARKDTKTEVLWLNF
jgi:DNA adenine methylase